MHPIEKEIRTWSANFLEVPSSLVNGLPICPYARKAWFENKVEFSIHNKFNTLFPTVKSYVENKNKPDVLIWTSYEYPEEQQYFEGLIDGINETLCLLKEDIYLMGFHPDFDAEDAGFDLLNKPVFDTIEEEEYVMVFMQPLSKLDDASLELEKTDYYKKFPQNIYETLILDRRRLRNGYDS